MWFRLCQFGMLVLFVLVQAILLCLVLALPPFAFMLYIAGFGWMFGWQLPWLDIFVILLLLELAWLIQTSKS